MHRFEHNVGQALIQAGQDEQIGSGQELRHVVAVAREPDNAVQPEGRRRRFELRAQRPFPNDQDPKRGQKVLDQINRGDEVVDPLLSRQTAGEDEQGSVRRPAEPSADLCAINRRRLLGADPRADQGQPFGRDSLPAIEIDHRLRVAHHAVGSLRQPAVERQLAHSSRGRRPSRP